MGLTKFLLAAVMATAFAAGPVLAQTATPATGGSTGSSTSSDQGTANSGIQRQVAEPRHFRALPLELLPKVAEGIPVSQTNLKSQTGVPS